MPPRYQQDRLQSPVTGTPGIDQSAGVVEKQIAQSSQQMHEAETALNIQNLRQAESNFQQSQYYFHHFAQQQAAEQRQAAALEAAKQKENRQLQAQFDRIDEDGRLDAVVSGLQSQYADSPQKAVEAFKGQLPSLRQQFQSRHVDDPEKLRMLMPSQRQQEYGALHQLQSWATQTATKNLENRLALMPAETEQKIRGITGDFNQQVIGYQKAIDGANQIYNSLHANALTQGVKDEIRLKQINFNNNAGKQFVEHLVAQTPDGEDGIKYLDTLHSSVQVAHMYGVSLDDKEKTDALQKISTLRNAHEAEVITGIKGNTDLNVLDASKLKTDLYNAANDKKAMAAIAQRVQGRLTALDQQIAQVSKEPDSKIKNAKLAGLKQEQNTYIGELGLELNRQRQFDSIQRAVESQARAIVSFNHGLINFAHSQEKWADYLQGKAKHEETQAAMEAVAKSKDVFNRNWAGVQQALASAWKKPAGPEQQAEISKVVNDAMPKLREALASGAVPADQYGNYIDQLRKQSEIAASKPKTGKDWFGNQTITPLSDKDKQKATAKADADFASIVERNNADFFAMNSSLQQLGSLSTSKAERTIMTQYVTAHLPEFMKDKRYQSANSAQQAQLRAKWIKSKLTAFRVGELK